MNEHLTEEQLVLHYYGEERDTGAGNHLAACSTCRDEYRKLQLVLNTVESAVPDRSADYESQLWARLSPRLRRSSWRQWLRPRIWAPAVAVTAMLVIAFLAGRYTQPGVPSSPPVTTANKGPVRERVLLVAVGDHLERSQMVLIEISNLQAAKNSDITVERDLARDLVEENRLYRQTALATGDTGVASVLDDLERVLLDIANSSGNLSGGELEALRQRIEAQGLIFKARVVGSQIRANESKPLTPPKGETTKL